MTIKSQLYALAVVWDLLTHYDFYRAYHKLTVKAEEVFWETRKECFLNIAVFTLRMFLQITSSPNQCGFIIVKALIEL